MWAVFIHILQFCIYLALLRLKILLTFDPIGVEDPTGVGTGVGLRVLLDLADRLRGGLIHMGLDPDRWMAGGLKGVWGAINITNINFIINY